MSERNSPSEQISLDASTNQAGHGPGKSSEPKGGRTSKVNPDLRDHSTGSIPPVAQRENVTKASLEVHGGESGTSGLYVVDFKRFRFKKLKAIDPCCPWNLEGSIVISIGGQETTLNWEHKKVASCGSKAKWCFSCCGCCACTECCGCPQPGCVKWTREESIQEVPVSGKGEHSYKVTFPERPNPHSDIQGKHHDFKHALALFRHEHAPSDIDILVRVVESDEEARKRLSTAKSVIGGMSTVSGKLDNVHGLNHVSHGLKAAGGIAAYAQDLVADDVELETRKSFSSRAILRHNAVITAKRLVAGEIELCVEMEVIHYPTKCPMQSRLPRAKGRIYLDRFPVDDFKTNALAHDASNWALEGGTQLGCAGHPGCCCFQFLCPALCSFLCGKGENCCDTKVFKSLLGQYSIVFECRFGDAVASPKAAGAQGNRAVEFTIPLHSGRFKYGGRMRDVFSFEHVKVYEGLSHLPIPVRITVTAVPTSDLKGLGDLFKSFTPVVNSVASAVNITGTNKSTDAGSNADDTNPADSNASTDAVSEEDMAKVGESVQSALTSALYGKRTLFKYSGVFAPYCEELGNQYRVGPFTFTWEQ